MSELTLYQLQVIFIAIPVYAYFLSLIITGSSMSKCSCGKYGVCPAKDSIKITDDGQVKIKSSEWFKCFKFKNKMEVLDKLELENKGVNNESL